MKNQDRLVTLDAMRGVAAFLVLLFHVGKVYPVWSPAKAYLAVDMFFALSGFVLARTNDYRFSKGLSWKEFMRRRIIRLYPLFFVGLIFGCLGLFIEWHERGATIGHAIGGILPNLFLLPSLESIDKPRLFVVNGPAWSLFCELWIANLLFALFWKRTSTRNLAFVITTSFAALVVLGWHFKMLDMGSVRITAIGGVARVLFSFAVGVLLWRIYQKYGCRYRLPSWAFVILLAVMLSVDLGRNTLGVAYDILAVSIIFPAMIYFGAGAHTRWPQGSAFAGDISYALYVTHEPLLLLWTMGFPEGFGAAVWLSTGFIAFALSVAFLLDYFFDEKARQWLVKSL